MQINKISKALERSKREREAQQPAARTDKRVWEERNDANGAVIENAMKKAARQPWQPTHEINPEAISPAIHAFHEQHSLVTEEYRIMRTNVNARNKDKAPQVLVFSSSVESEGKTISAINYSYTIACDRTKKVLLIDGDLRKGTMARYFGFSASSRKGIADVLNGDEQIENVISASGRENLHIIFRGSSIDHPAEAIGSAVMEKVIAEARKQYDHIIIDVPPVLPVTDAAVVSRLVDGVILVVKLNQTPKTVVQQAMETFKQAQAPIIGYVLTNVEYLTPGYKKYYYYESYGVEQK